ncbi:glycosyltransferase [Mariniflexile sp.]|uniref:glycosyltransferase n=1 Tax=Mariniflexile sp. TaxID=1979402 RepID=UPI0035621FD5
MKVLHVIDRMDPEQGGVCQAVRTIATGLLALGVTNNIVSLDPKDASFLATDALSIHALGPAENPWCYSKRLLPWLQEHATAFDVILVHGLWQYPSYAVYKTLAKLKSAPRLFVMPHGMLDPYFQRAAGRQLKAIRNVLYWALIEKQVVNSANGLLFTCAAERDLARVPFKPYQPKRELVVGLGVEAPPAYTPAMTTAFQTKCPELQGSPYILFLSRIHEKKGVDLLLQAYARLLNARSASGAGIETCPKLVIAGPGLETPYGKKIGDMLNQNSLLKDQVYFPGMLKGKAKWGGFYGCEAFILPSHQENFGIAVVEALACSKPVLISNQVNIWTEIAQAGGGMVDADTEAGTHSMLHGFIQMPASERAAMASNARACFEQYFAVGPATAKLFAAITSQKDV